MRSTSFFLLASLLPCAAAQPVISTPLLAYVYDPGVRAIRALRGIPGAAALAETVDAGFPVAAAAVAPSHNFAIAISTAGEIRIVDWRTGTATSTVLAGAMSSPDGLAFSSSGAVAVISDSQSGHIQLVTSMPATPVIQEIAPAGGAPPTAIAVADDGTIAFAAADGVHLVGADGAPSSLPLPTSIVALAFAPSGDDLLAATTAGDLYLAADVSADAVIRKIGSDDRLAAPVAVQFSADESTAFVSTQAGTVASVDLNSGAAATLSCQCAPDALERLGNANLFRLTGVSNRPVLIFDGTPQSPRLWFIPAADSRNAQ